jgi:hypothetical protein
MAQHFDGRTSIDTLRVRLDLDAVLLSGTSLAKARTVWQAATKESETKND